MGEGQGGWEAVRKTAGCLPWGAGISLFISVRAVTARPIISACSLRTAPVKGMASVVGVWGGESSEQKLDPVSGAC